MRRLGTSLALVGLLVLVAPAAASRAVSPTATLRVAVPAEGDVTVAEAVFKLRGGRVNRVLHPRLRVLNAARLGRRVVVVATITQEPRDRSRLDVTAAVIRRGTQTTGTLRSELAAIPDALLRVDEPDLRGATSPRLTRVTTFGSTNVVMGNAFPRYPRDCGPTAASYLSGDRAGLPAAQQTLSFSCGLALDQGWMPTSFASEIGASWCGGLFGPPTSGSTTYPAGFDCNFPISAFAVQDPGKSVGVTGLTLVPPLTGRCQAPFQQPYIGVCSLSTPLAANTPGPFTMTLAGTLPAGSEFGFTASSGGTQRSFPMRELDAAAALGILNDLIGAYPHDASDSGIVAGRTKLAGGDLIDACRILHHSLWVATGSTRPSLVDIAARLRDALKALDCNER